ncbi:MAG TPA: transcription antitermination factor NusB [candidate division Zixibacteria bacterium]|nr:transcription antitermination factor NusB [candidate division Zixibacteria bacterium]
MSKVKRPPRHQARELVLKALYALDCGTEESFESLSKETALAEKHLKFAGELFETCRKNVKWADEQITLLATNWRIERINYIDKNILRMAMVELQYMPDAPLKVVLNEAIELAKTFSTHESAAFVNGILDSFAKALLPKPASI